MKKRTLILSSLLLSLILGLSGCSSKETAVSESNSSKTASSEEISPIKILETNAISREWTRVNTNLDSNGNIPESYKEANMFNFYRYDGKVYYGDYDKETLKPILDVVCIDNDGKLSFEYWSGEGKIVYYATFDMTEDGTEVLIGETSNGMLHNGVKGVYKMVDAQYTIEAEAYSEANTIDKKDKIVYNSDGNILDTYLYDYDINDIVHKSTKNTGASSIAYYNNTLARKDKLIELEKSYATYNATDKTIYFDGTSHGDCFFIVSLKDGILERLPYNPGLQGGHPIVEYNLYENIIKIEEITHDVTIDLNILYEELGLSNNVIKMQEKRQEEEAQRKLLKEEKQEILDKKEALIEERNQIDKEQSANAGTKILTSRFKNMFIEEVKKNIEEDLINIPLVASCSIDGDVYTLLNSYSTNLCQVRKLGDDSRFYYTNWSKTIEVDKNETLCEMPSELYKFEEFFDIGKKVFNAAFYDKLSDDIVADSLKVSFEADEENEAGERAFIVHVLTDWTYTDGREFSSDLVVRRNGDDKCNVFDLSELTYNINGEEVSERFNTYAEAFSDVYLETCDEVTSSEIARTATDSNELYSEINKKMLTKIEEMYAIPDAVNAYFQIRSFGYYPKSDFIYDTYIETLILSNVD